MKITDFERKKSKNSKISMLTCYDYPSAKIVSESNVDCVLVGDSVAMTVHGYNSTMFATMDMMVMHTSAVARGLKNQFLVADLPFLSYREDMKTTINNVKMLLQAGAHAVKLEGADATLCKTINYLVNSGISVMGHIGLTPQSYIQLGGYKVQGKTEEAAQLLLNQAQSLQDAGCFAIVIECVPEALATQITNSLKIPTIGIGAGKNTDGQVMVWHDILGIQSEMNLKFVKQYVNCKDSILNAINIYANDVQKMLFPSLEHSF